MRTPANQPIESHIRRESATGNPLTKFVNLLQTPEERRDKYAFCRECGASRNLAYRLRDFRWTKLNLFLDAYLHPRQLPLITTPPGGLPRAALSGVSDIIE